MLQRLSVPIAIVLAGGLIAGALYYVSAKTGTAGSAGNVPQQQQQALANIPGIQPTDHVQGNPNAPIVFVEYADPECPHCKEFESVMEQVMANYGASGKVAWVYRHFPIPQLHPKAIKESQALECAAKVGGEDGFWKYLSKLFAVTPSDNGLDLAQLPVIATDVGLDKTTFESCLNSDYGKTIVSNSMSQGIKDGITGTPTTIVFANGTSVPLVGYYPYSSVKQLIDSTLQSASATSTAQ